METIFLDKFEQAQQEEDNFKEMHATEVKAIFEAIIVGEIFWMAIILTAVATIMEAKFFDQANYFALEEIAFILEEIVFILEEISAVLQLVSL